MTALKPSEILSRAADLITPEGAWRQGNFCGDKRGRGLCYFERKNACSFCMVGAVAHAENAPLAGENEEVIAFALQAIGMEPDREWSDLSRWQDDAARTQSEVVAALRKASTLALESGE